MSEQRKLAKTGRAINNVPISHCCDQMPVNLRAEEFILAHVSRVSIHLDKEGVVGQAAAYVNVGRRESREWGEGERRGEGRIAFSYLLCH